MLTMPRIGFPHFPVTDDDTMAKLRYCNLIFKKNLNGCLVGQPHCLSNLSGCCNSTLCFSRQDATDCGFFHLCKFCEFRSVHVALVHLCSKQFSVHFISFLGCGIATETILAPVYIAVNRNFAISQLFVYIEIRGEIIWTI